MKIKHLIAIVALLATALSASAQLLWKVEGNGLAEPSYLFGTHHLAPLSTIDRVGACQAFNEAAQVVGEIDMTQDQMALALAMQPHMVAPPDSTLSKVIAPADMAIINEEFKKWAPMPGMELSMLDMMKPMVVTSMVAVNMVANDMPDFTPGEQLDTYFQTQGKTDGKTIVPLETAEYQATVLFDLSPIAYQAEALVEMLKNPAKTVASAKELNEAYMAQDLDKMLSLSKDEDEHPEFMLALLDRRNAEWLAKLPAILAQAPSFVAVGAMHLAGPNGLVEGLRKQGYTVTPVK